MDKTNIVLFQGGEIIGFHRTIKKNQETTDNTKIWWRTIYC